MTTQPLETDDGDIEFRPRYATEPSPNKKTSPKKRGGLPGMLRLVDSKLTIKSDETYEQWNFTDICDGDFKLGLDTYGKRQSPFE